MKKLLVILILISLWPADAAAIRLFTSGFEQQTVTAGEEFSSNGIGTGAIDTTTKRTGAAAMRLNPTAGNSWMGQIRATSAASGEMFGRLYIRYASFPTSDAEVFGFWDSVGVTRQCYIEFDAVNNTLQAKDSLDAQAGSDSAALSLNTWYIVELDCLPGAGTGDVKARLGADDGTDPTEFASNLSMTVSNLNAMYIGAAATAETYDMYFDDWAMNDTATTNASTQTSYPSYGKVAMAICTGAGDGAASAGDCTAIDEVDPNDATDFVDIDTAIDADYAMQDSSTIGIDSYDTITLVDVKARVREEASAATLFHMRIKSAASGTTLQTADGDLGTTVWRTSPIGGNNAQLHRLATTTDPTTGLAWTPTGTNSIDNMQAGFGISDSDDVDISTLWVNVEYRDGSPPASAPSRQKDPIIWFD